VLPSVVAWSTLSSTETRRDASLRVSLFTTQHCRISAVDNARLRPCSSSLQNGHSNADKVTTIASHGLTARITSSWSSSDHLT